MCATFFFFPCTHTNKATFTQSYIIIQRILNTEQYIIAKCILKQSLASLAGKIEIRYRYDKNIITQITEPALNPLFARIFKHFYLYVTDSTNI